MLLSHMTSYELPTLVVAAGVGFLAGMAVCFTLMRGFRSGTQVAESTESDR